MPASASPQLAPDSQSSSDLVVSSLTSKLSQDAVFDEAVFNEAVSNEAVSKVAVSSAKSSNIATEHIVIIGAGMAGSHLAIKLATELQQADDEQSIEVSPHTLPTPTITLISKEPEVGYNRIMLSPVLSGETAFADTYLYEQSEYERLGIHIMAGVSVDSIDTDNQHLILDNGDTLNYDKLVLATGSMARVIPFPNHDAQGVHVFRDVADVTVLSEYAKQGKTGLVIGGGVLGLEAACALSSQGATMTVIHVDGYVLNRQLDLPAALMLQEELARRSVELEVSAATTQIEKNAQGEVTGLSLKDGRILPADFIVMAVGIVPSTKLASDSGIEVNRGIVVDTYMHTNCHNVYAIGECIEINEELFGMVSSVNQHVETLVSVLTAKLYPQVIPPAKPSVDVPNSAIVLDTTSQDAMLLDIDKQHWLPFVSRPLSLKLKVTGVAVFSAGQISFSDEEQETVETVVYREVNSQHYQCLFIKDNCLIGAVLYGEVNEGGFYNQLINERTDISAFKDDLIYGAAYCEVAGAA